MGFWVFFSIVLVGLLALWIALKVKQTPSKHPGRAINKLDENRSYTRGEVTSLYKKEGYEVGNFLDGAPHGSDVQFIRQRNDGKQDHARIYVEKDSIKVEEHRDRVSPKRNFLGHFFVDVIGVGTWNLAEKLRLVDRRKNPNFTYRKELKKKKKTRRKKK